MQPIKDVQNSNTVRKRNNLTTSVTVLDELPVSDLFKLGEDGVLRPP